MPYVLVRDDQVIRYPYTLLDLRTDNPDVSFPETFPETTLAEFGVFTVRDSPRPIDDHTKNVVEGVPALIEGSWIQIWVQTDASSEEIVARIDAKWDVVRLERNARLSACDWTQLPDAPVSETVQEAWAIYRQALRDITQQENPFAIAWPTSPA